MNKITTLRGASIFSKSEQRNGKTVGLIVGSFDILHLGHGNLFSYAKKHCDIVIVGLDNDKTIKLVKGFDRPVNNCLRRAKLLSLIQAVDKIFEIKPVSHHDSEQAYENYIKIVLRIAPTHIFTHKACDSHWKKKKEIARRNGINFLLDRSVKISNSGTIINKILQDF